ncbi:hypothetical protein [Robertkochia flava]|uniref:hypothetical protein n=1 Tax=Robertkochia flava TaxID=3447986 RepID=UPI001CCBC5DE|nr:hypothetical protein [Robertkochia marina]
MIKFFRNIRKTNLKEGKIVNYLKYAFGEIFLVVIGILIALSINNRQHEIQNRNLEVRYITDIISDLRKDSTNLQSVYAEATLTSNAKDSIVKLLNHPELSMDSLPRYFLYQWNPYKIFSPSTSTIDEMKSSSNLDIIKDDVLRKKIVGIYYTYDLFLQDENLYREATREIFTMAKERLKNINSSSGEEIKLLLREPKVANTIRKNFANGRLRSVENVSDECSELLKVLLRYQKEITKAQPWL